MSKPRIMIGVDPASGPDRAGVAVVRDGVIESIGDFPRLQSTAELAKLQGVELAALNARIDAEYAARSADIRAHFERDAAIMLGISPPCEAFAPPAIREVRPLSVVFSTPSNDKNGKPE